MSGRIDPERPTAYAGPRNGLERRICRFLFQFMLGGSGIHFVFGNASIDGVDDAQDSDFAVAVPDLWITFKILLRPNLWVGESYVAGKWYLIRGDLADFLEAIYVGANPAFRSYYRLLSGMRGLNFLLRQHLLTYFYTRKVASHYEVDSRVYELILDEDMLYTCAFFNTGYEELAAAQKHKLAVTIERLSLPSGHAAVLDIGCGWGAIERAVVQQHPTARVCGLTISQSQIDWARNRDAACLSGEQAQRIEYRLEDYLNHHNEGHYDAISVVGMIEHVGLSGYPAFFEKIYTLLKPGGNAVIHTIVSPDPAHPTNAWIDRHIFTGGHAPSISELIRCAEIQGFRIAGVHIYPPRHYRRTIECWLLNFRANLRLIEVHLRSRGSSNAEIDRFVRVWTFYLSGVRNMFAEEGKGSHQIVQLCLQRLEDVGVPQKHADGDA